jgi:hypothetical protein
MVGATVACRPATPELCGGGRATSCPTAMIERKPIALFITPQEQSI